MSLGDLVQLYKLFVFKKKKKGFHLIFLTAFPKWFPTLLVIGKEKQELKYEDVTQLFLSHTSVFELLNTGTDFQPQ